MILDESFKAGFQLVRVDPVIPDGSHDEDFGKAGCIMLGGEVLKEAGKVSDFES